jgi:hypothetical protein
LEWLISEIEGEVSEVIRSMFWQRLQPYFKLTSSMTATDTLVSQWCTHRMAIVIHIVCRSHLYHCDLIRTIGGMLSLSSSTAISSYINGITLLYRSHIFTNVPTWWPSLLRIYFTTQFNQHALSSYHIIKHQTDNNIMITPQGDTDMKSASYDTIATATATIDDSITNDALLLSLLGTLNSVCQSYSYIVREIQSLEWSSILQPHYIAVIYTIIDDHIQSRCHHRVTHHINGGIVSHVLYWLDDVVMRWLSGVIGGMEYESWHNRLKVFVHQRLALLRTNELLSIIMSYPTTRNALTDLRLCLFQTSSVRWLPYLILFAFLFINH